MTHSEITNHRLQNQQIAYSAAKNTKELVSWMGAMQAQDFQQAKWAIGVRLPKLTEQQIESAFNQGSIIRSHLLRPTWHLVSSDDIYWLIELSAPQIKSATKSRHRDLELSENVLKRSTEVIIDVLEGKKSLTREELNGHLNQAGINTGGQRLPHILMQAEIDAVICSGPIRGKNQTYALLAERVQTKYLLQKEEALALLAKKYFSSHGPATLLDFGWWSGLPIKDARLALELNKAVLSFETIGSDTYWYNESDSEYKTLPDSAYLLPAFDEYLIAYQNRSALIDADHHKKAISNNGIFRPVIVVNGKISGLWKRKIKKDIVQIELEHFVPQNNKVENLIRKASDSFGYFSGKTVELKPLKT